MNLFRLAPLALTGAVFACSDAPDPTEPQIDRQYLILCMRTSYQDCDGSGGGFRVPRAPWHPPPPPRHPEGGEGGYGDRGDGMRNRPPQHDDDQFQACDSGQGQRYGGRWYTCMIRRNGARDETMGALIRLNRSRHEYCGVIAEEWERKRISRDIGWWREAIPRGPVEIQLGHYHDKIPPLGEIHIFEGNAEHPRSIADWVETAAHETIHALGFTDHSDIIRDGIDFIEMASICSGIGRGR